MLVPSRTNGNGAKKVTKSKNACLMSLDERGELLGRHMEADRVVFNDDDRIEAINNQLSLLE